jgi:hypothetical protein
VCSTERTWFVISYSVKTHNNLNTANVAYLLKVTLYITYYTETMHLEKLVQILDSLC